MAQFLGSRCGNEKEKKNQHHSHYSVVAQLVFSDKRKAEKC